jgi:hypothetical protein
VIEIESKGSFNNTEDWLKRMSKGDIFTALEAYAKKGVLALEQATPLDSGETARSWTYTIEHSRGRYEIIFRNTHIVNGTPIAILIQYGHGTGTGGYVQGRDYINPVIQPLFDQIANDVWKVVTRR